MHSTKTTTISLPVKTAQRAKQLSRREGRTMSELFREAFRFYEAYSKTHTHPSRLDDRTWIRLRGLLRDVSESGKKKNLAGFIARDRQAH